MAGLALVQPGDGPCASGKLWKPKLLPRERRQADGQ